MRGWSPNVVFFCVRCWGGLGISEGFRKGFGIIQRVSWRFFRGKIIYKNYIKSKVKSLYFQRFFLGILGRFWKGFGTYLGVFLEGIWRVIWGSFRRYKLCNSVLKNTWNPCELVRNHIFSYIFSSFPTFWPGFLALDRRTGEGAGGETRVVAGGRREGEVQFYSLNIFLHFLCFPSVPSRPSRGVGYQLITRNHVGISGPYYDTSFRSSTRTFPNLPGT